MPSVYIFIDAENIDPSSADQIIATARSYGTVVQSELYGAGIALNEWAEPIMRYALHPNVTIKPNRYKNSSDIALVIGAMSILIGSEADDAGHYRNEPYIVDENGEEVSGDTVIIASSDSDFSPLAVKLRGCGYQVVGMGEPDRANRLWELSCSKYITMKPSGAAAGAVADASTVVPAGVPSANDSAADGSDEDAASDPSAIEDAASAEDNRRGPTPHYFRVKHIRALIDTLLKENGGRMLTSDLFTALNDDADYQEDFRTSKKHKPLEYITTQYSNHYYVDEGDDDRLWIFLKPYRRNREASKDTTSDSVIPTQDVEGVAQRGKGRKNSTRRKHTAAENTSAESKTTATSAAVSANTTQLDALVSAGVPEADVPKLISIYYSSSNGRELYNRLRKEYGSANGRSYFQILKNSAK